VKHLIHGQTGGEDFFLKDDGVAVDLTNKTVTLVLKDRNGNLIAHAGTVAVVSPATAGRVKFTPAAADLDSTKSPYLARFKVTSGSEFWFYPSEEADEWIVFPQ
jgi:hypothetical protein